MLSGYHIFVIDDVCDYKLDSRGIIMLSNKKLLSMLLLCLVIVVITACSSNSSTNQPASNNATDTPSKEVTNAKSEKVKLSFFNTSAEVNTVFEDLIKEYEGQNPNVSIEMIPTPIGGAQIEKFQSLLVSGNAPTIANLDAGTILQYKDYFLNLESEKAKYEKLTKPGAVEGALLDGEFIGIPYSAQGYGLLYNTRVIEEVIGGSFDPNSIQTRNDLEALFEKIDAAGIAPVMMHGADWSIGAHYLGLAYSLQSNDVEKNRAFVEDLKNGKVDLASNAAFTGLIDTFDLLVKYNARKADPLVADYNKDSIDFATGKSAFFFMGDWSWAGIGGLEGRDSDFGVIPVPISNNPDDFGNKQVAYSEPKLFAIDKSSSTVEEQEAAKIFIEWLVTSKQAQDTIVTVMGLSMPYKEVSAVSTNVMSNAIGKFVDEGNYINISVINYLPQDYWAKTGSSMQKYMAGIIDRTELIQEVTDYWKSYAGQ